MKTTASTVTEYLAALPEDRRQAVRKLRTLVKKHLPKGYTESIAYGSIMWAVPLAVYPDTYNRQPLAYVMIANQKNHMSLHLVCAYMNPPLRQKLADGFQAAGKKLDMGMGCLRFKRLEDLGQEITAPEQQTPAALGAHHKAEIDKWWPLIKQAGIKAD